MLIKPVTFFLFQRNIHTKINVKQKIALTLALSLIAYLKDSPSVPNTKGLLPKTE